MTIRTDTDGFQESYEYHGNTVIEHVRLKGGRISRDWIMFNSADEAELFFNEQCVS